MSTHLPSQMSGKGKLILCCKSTIYTGSNCSGHVIAGLKSNNQGIGSYKGH